MSNLYELSASEIVRKINSRELLISEIAESFVNRIREINPVINAIQQFDPEKILFDAFNTQELLSTTQSVGKLFGVPVSIKDAFHVKDFICSKGSLGLYHAKSSFDATAVSRLKIAGAKIYGITNTSELLLSYESDNLVYGRTNNPYDLTKSAGGSSGGEAPLSRRVERQSALEMMREEVFGNLLIIVGSALINQLMDLFQIQETFLLTDLALDLN